MHHRWGRAAAGCAAVALVAPALVAGGCGRDGAKGEKSGGKGQAGGGKPREDAPVSVDVVLAKPGSLRREAEYAGTTAPVRDVAVRAQTDARVQSLTVDIGDRVRRGQVLARLDPDLLRTALNQARGELAAQQSEVASAQSLVGDARAKVEQARQDLEQKRADAERYEYLAREGAGARQTAEQARTAAEIAQQVVVAARQQVKNAERAVEAARSRVNAQRALVAQAQERLTYTAIRSPLDGVVLGRATEAGNLLSPGAEVFRLGDLSRLFVAVQVSELDLSPIRVGKRVPVRLDALPGREVYGTISRVSPAADPVSRLVPVDVLIPNVENRVGSGLLARVRFTDESKSRVLIPEGALQAGRGQATGPGGAPAGGGGRAPGATPGTGAAASSVLPGGAGNNPGGGDTARPASGPAPETQVTADRFTRRETDEVVMVVDGQAEDGQVQARKVRIGARADGLAEVIEGLRPGERVVARSARPLKGGERVRLSVISEGRPQPKQGQQGGRR